MGCAISPFLSPPVSPFVRIKTLEFGAREGGWGIEQINVSIFVKGLRRAGKRTFACPRLLTLNA